MPTTTQSTTESAVDQIRRVEMMSTDSGLTWDLSDNDQAALRALLNQRADLLAALKAMVASYDGVRDVLICKTVIDKLARADAAIVKAEGAK